jgi:hypothetical protein
VSFREPPVDSESNRIGLPLPPPPPPQQQRTVSEQVTEAAGPRIKSGRAAATNDDSDSDIASLFDSPTATRRPRQSVSLKSNSGGVDTASEGEGRSPRLPPKRRPSRAKSGKPSKAANRRVAEANSKMTAEDSDANQDDEVVIMKKSTRRMLISGGNSTGPFAAHKFPNSQFFPAAKLNRSSK